MAFRLKLDHKGIGQVLKSAEVAKAIAEVGHDVAARAQTDEAVSRHGAEVKVTPYTTDRAAVGVTIAHAAGVGIEAKHGVLSRAAGAEGLEVRGRE